MRAEKKSFSSVGWASGLGSEPGMQVAPLAWASPSASSPAPGGSGLPGGPFMVAHSGSSGALALSASTRIEKLGLSMPSLRKAANPFLHSVHK